MIFPKVWLLDHLHQNHRLPVKNTKSWPYPPYTALGKWGQMKSQDLHFENFRGFLCTFEFKSHCFESLNGGANSN